MNSIVKSLTMALVALTWSPINAAKEHQHGSQPVDHSNLAQYNRPGRPVPPAAKEPVPQHVAQGPTIPFQSISKRQETHEESAQRTQDIERLKRMQQIEKHLGKEVLLRSEAEGPDNKPYKMNFLRAGESSEVRTKMAQEDQEALKKEYAELQKVDKQRRAEIRAKQEATPGEEIVLVGQGIKPSEAAAQIRAKRAAAADEPQQVSARDLRKMGPEEARRLADELNKQAQAEPAQQPSQIKFTADDLKKIKEDVESHQKIEKMREEAMTTPGFQEKYDAWMDKKDSTQQDQGKIATLKDKFFSKTESAKDSIKEAAQNFKSKIFSFFGGGKKTSEKNTLVEKPLAESPIIPQNTDIYTQWKKVPPSPEMQAEIEKAQADKFSPSPLEREAIANIAEKQQQHEAYKASGSKFPPPPPEFLRPVTTDVKQTKKIVPTEEERTARGAKVLGVTPEEFKKIETEDTKKSADRWGVSPDVYSRYGREFSVQTFKPSLIESHQSIGTKAAQSAKAQNLSFEDFERDIQSSSHKQIMKEIQLEAGRKVFSSAETEPKISVIPLAPPPPPAAEKVPPPAPPRAAPAAQPKEEMAAQGNSDLLEQIKQGKKLSSAEDRQLAPKKEDDIKTSLAAAIQARRKNMKEDEEDTSSDW